MPRKKIFEHFDNIAEDGKAISNLLSNLHYTHFYLNDAYKKKLLVYDLSMPQINVLGIVAYFHPKSMTLESIKHMVLEQNSDVSRLVSRLEEKKLLKKETDKKNRRKVSIGLTPKGLEILKAIETEKLFDNFISEITEEEAIMFTKVLTKLRKAVDL